MVGHAQDLQIDSSDWRVRMALNYMERTYCNSDLRLNAVAEFVGISSAYLSHLIRRKTGSTFRSLLMDTRLRHAIRQLQTTVKSVKEIAADVGYGNTSALDRACRRRFGRAPSDWRRCLGNRHP